MFRVRRDDPLETGDLNVFVPGLMAAGLMMSMGMLIADASRRLWGTRGKRARTIELARRAAGRVSDLQSVGIGVAPIATKLIRIPRNAVASGALALGSFATAVAITRTTVGAYSARTGSLAHRGWTLTGGLGLAGAFALLGAIALLLALSARYKRPAWLLAAARYWPLGQLPDPNKATG
jgi:hypothetical protein